MVTAPRRHPRLAAGLLTAGIIAGALATGAPASAGAQVAYYTTGTFSGGSTPGTNVYTVDGFRMTYTGVGSPGAPAFTVPASAGAAFGVIGVNSPGQLPAAISGTFTLSIFAVSSVGVTSGQLVAILSGLLNENTSANTAVLDATAAGSVWVGGTQFSYRSIPLAPPLYRLIPANTSILQGTATSPAVVPEPGTFGLVAVGALWCAGVAVRRRRT